MSSGIYKRNKEMKTGKTRLKKKVKEFYCEICNKKFINWSIFKRRFCSNKCKHKSLSVKNKGNGNPCWKGGIVNQNKIIRNSIEFNLWRQSIFSKDGWICQNCKIKGGKLHAHHILNFSEHIEIRFAIDNGITLCEKCHWNFHKIYGKKNNSREQLKEFIEVI